MGIKSINTRRPTHPGGILKRHYIEPLSLTISDIAKDLGVSRKTISKIVNEKAAITPDMALRLAKAFNTSPELWLNMQAKYDLWFAEQESPGLEKIALLVPAFIPMAAYHDGIDKKGFAMTKFFFTLQLKFSRFHCKI